MIQTASRSELARIVARESAETIAGRDAGRRVSAIRHVLRPAAELMARRFVQYDDALADRGTVGGAEWILTKATGGVAVSGAANMPSTGPVLVVANHPGLADAVALLAAMRRDDAWIVTADYPFLRALRRASARFLFVDDRCTTLRHIVRRLRDGHAVLLFPAGGLEPDPARALDAARASLRSWSRSVEAIARLVPGLRVVPAAVDGVVSREAFANPLARRRAPVRERQRLASLLQLAFSAYRHDPVRVRFAPALAGATGTHTAMLDAMRMLLSAGMSGEQR